ncbi:hypothetical protein BFP70_06970 [Thioclava sp. SK-1]|uniref:glycosyltransferase family 2 protein n=1 Tax=Thioclava sp. SK-1 TaxID=1889770 RepID=UPI000826D1DA|nr:glycosyltransferase family 2 protein [Thioclava sp. SK-1]OCX65873.1 hypothetical protein BFP70_06970 [Thioclava sp. SK-1]
MRNYSKTEPGLPRWGVVGTVDEPAILLAAWVAHHLAVGASEVHVFHDRPNPQAQTLLAGVAGCFQYFSGDDGWRRHWRGKRPDRVETRQKYNATRVLSDSGLDWVAHCDADEFIHIFGPVDRELASVTEKAWLRLAVDERCYLSRDTVGRGNDIFAGGFRQHWPGFDTQGARVYGPRQRYLNQGCCGHTAGKSITRAGQGYAIGVHYPLKDWNTRKLTLPYRRATNARILHFDGLTPLHYLLKMMRRAMTVVKGDPIPMSTPRQTQFAHAVKIADLPSALMDLWWLVQGMDAAAVAALLAQGAWAGQGSPVLANAQALFPELDFSAAAFDAALLDHEAALIAKAYDRFGFDAQALAIR